jgi:hypothetical protein
MPEAIDSEQFNAQHNRVASVKGVFPLRALSQHFIIFSLGECNGVPETTPPTTPKSTKKIIGHSTITN